MEGVIGDDESIFFGPADDLRDYDMEELHRDKLKMIQSSLDQVYTTHEGIPRVLQDLQPNCFIHAGYACSTPTRLVTGPPTFMYVDSENRTTCAHAATSPKDAITVFCKLLPKK